MTRSLSISLAMAVFVMSSEWVAAGLMSNSNPLPASSWPVETAPASPIVLALATNAIPDAGLTLPQVPADLSSPFNVSSFNVSTGRNATPIDLSLPTTGHGTSTLPFQGIGSTSFSRTSSSGSGGGGGGGGGAGGDGSPGQRSTGTGRKTGASSSATGASSSVTDDLTYAIVATPPTPASLTNAIGPTTNPVADTDALPASDSSPIAADDALTNLVAPAILNQLDVANSGDSVAFLGAPEPGTFVILSCGLATLILLRRGFCKLQD
jgi:hypothetical protein